MYMFSRKNKESMRDREIEKESTYLRSKVNDERERIRSKEKYYRYRFSRKIQGEILSKEGEREREREEREIKSKK